MMRHLRQILAFIIAAVAVNAFAAPADSVSLLRPALVTVAVDAGRVRSLDTYLSPLRYDGMHLRLGFELQRLARFCPKKWVGKIEAGLTYDHPSNPARNNSLHTVIADVDYALLRRLYVGGATFYAGGDLGFRGGVTYNPRNSNNVCSPLIHLYLGASGGVAYDIWRRRAPLTLRWQATLPVVGGFYLPDYDQSFYEMYLGNYGKTINFGFWHNRFDMDNLVCLDLQFGPSTLRLGYRTEFTTVWQNNISQRRWTHSLVIGVQWETLRLNSHYGLPMKSEIISVTY